jgi:hypothetical protein
MKTIPISQDLTAIIDDEDFARVSPFKWYASVRRRKDGTIYTIYAFRKYRREDGKRSIQMLHRFILGITDPQINVDHEDHNGLNCRRQNMRVATETQNQGNRRKQKSSSQFKGVTWYGRKSKWQSQIRFEGKQKHLGYFNSEIDAAKAYDVAARKQFGEFALVNF